jgi:hypothetical protein
MNSVSFTVASKELSLAPPPPWFRPLLEYWESKRRDGRLPARADVDPVDLKTVLGWLSLIEVRPTEPRFFIRLLGSALPHRPNGPRHGQDIQALRPVAHRDTIMRQYDLALERRAPTLHENQLGFGIYRLSYQRIVLPLAKDHVTPNMLMIATLIDPAEHVRFFSAYELAMGSGG